MEQIGSTYRNFKIVKALPIIELQSFLVELIHEPTGARVLHIANEDPENLFCLSLQTLPESSNGVAHILEHTVLCGSKKFPVKDPFFAMNRRSLNTFMNALTGSDFTCYPASSQVPKDFYNLLEVYLDAVFHPLLNELSFMQEGWRLEYTNPTDPNSPLEYKGIVFNEMKGVMASGTSRLNEAINQQLFPDLTYGHNSGGEPRDIPALSYEELKAFHTKFYHPSRCLFFFYGNLPIRGHLDFISEHLLDHVEAVPALPAIPLQKRFIAPVYRELTYPISPDEDPASKTMISFAWLTCHILEQLELLALNVIEIALMDTDASPLKKALLKSGLCKQTYSYLEAEISEVPFVIIAKGCEPEDGNALEAVIKNTLRQVAEEGIPKQLIDNAMHQLEFHRSEITGDSAPFGLSLFMRSCLLKQHGGMPEDGLMIHTHFEQLRIQLREDPRFLEGLIVKHLLENQHFVRLVMKPDAALAAKELAEEKAIVDQLQKTLTPGQVEVILHKSAELAEFQEKQSEENVDVLPTVTLADVPKKSRHYLLATEKKGNLEVFQHSCFTNEIIYADLIFPMPSIKAEDLPYARLFSNLLPQVGCSGRDYSANLEYMHGNTGGVGAALSLNLQAANYEQYTPAFHLKGKALHRKASHLFKLLKEMSEAPDFTDVPRLKEILLKHYTGLQSGLNQNALRYAINLSASCLNQPGMIANAWYGLQYFWKVREIALNFEEHADQLVAKLQQMQKMLLCNEGAHLVLTCEKPMYDQLAAERFYGLQEIKANEYEPWKANYEAAPLTAQGRIISSPVSFIGKVFNTISYAHPDAPALAVAAHLFDNLILHTRIREQGGAYGGGASNNAISGNFYFYSYRDPNISATLKAFDEAVKVVVEGDFDDEDLQEAKLEMIQGMDSPVAPGSRGDLAYGWWREGRTVETRQAFRDRLLALTSQEIKDAVIKHIVSNISNGVPIVFAGKELLEKENPLLGLQGHPSLNLEIV